MILIKETKRRIRQERLAKIFYEMGMDIDLVSKISGVEAEKITKYVKVDFAAIGTGWPFEEFPVNLDEYTFLGTVHDGLVYMWHYYYKVLEN